MSDAALRDAATLLGLLRLASPALPVGAYSYSEGLEAAVEAGAVAGESAAADWLCDQLGLVLARAELPLAAAALVAWQHDDRERIDELNRWYAATRESTELRAQSEQMGRSLAAWLANGDDAADPRIAALAALRPAPHWPLAFALAAAQTGATPRDALLAAAFGWAENMAQAAIKAVPLGQSAAQRILGRLAHAIPATVDAALARPEDAWQSFAPMLAVLSARHESQYSRLFRS